MAFPLFAPFLEDLNNTLRDLELLRQAAKNATALIQQTTHQTTDQSWSGKTSSGCECGEGARTTAVPVDEDGMVQVNIDVLCCFFLAALIFGTLLGLKMAGSEAEAKEWNGGGQDGRK